MRVRLPRLDSDALASAPRGWTYANGVVTVKSNDRFEPVRLAIEF